MKPDDESGELPPEKRPFRVLVIAGPVQQRALYAVILSTAKPSPPSS